MFLVSLIPQHKLFTSICIYILSFPRIDTQGCLYIIFRGKLILYELNVAKNFSSLVNQVLEVAS